MHFSSLFSPPSPCTFFSSSFSSIVALLSTSTCDSSSRLFCTAPCEDFSTSSLYSKVHRDLYLSLLFVSFSVCPYLDHPHLSVQLQRNSAVFHLEHQLEGHFGRAASVQKGPSPPLADHAGGGRLGQTGLPFQCCGNPCLSPPLHHLLSQILHLLG